MAARGQGGSFCSITPGEGGLNFGGAAQLELEDRTGWDLGSWRPPGWGVLQKEQLALGCGADRAERSRPRAWADEE